MFDLFRSRDKVVRIMLGGLLLLVALSMLTYLVPSYNVGSGDSSEGVVAQVGKDTITMADVRQIIEANMRGRQMPPELLAHYVPQFVNNMVTERAMAYEAQRLGFKVSNADLASGIRQTLPQLFQDGKFAGKQAYEAMLAQQNMTIPEFEGDMARQMLINKLRDIAMQGIVVTPQQIKTEYQRLHDKVKLQYVKITGDKFRADIKVTPEELHQYYDSHKALYQVPEKRTFGILIIDEAKLEQTVQPTEADLLKVYNDNKDSYRLPERVDVRHILLKSDGKDPKQDAAVKAKAEDLVKQLRKGANFAEMAKKYSEDPGSKDKGGEYDGVVRGQMVPEFEKAAFSLKVGEISDPVKTTYGYHILQVLKHEPAQLKPFNDVKAQLAEEYKKQRVNDLMQQLSDKTQAALEKDPLHPDKVAADMGVQYVTSGDVGDNDPMPQIGVNKDFQQSIIGLKKGDVSQPVVIPGNKIVMAVVLGETPAHPASFDDVQARVHDALVREKLAKLLDQKATDLVAKAQASGDFAAAAKSLGLEAKTSDAVDHAGAIEGLGSAGMFPDAFTKPVGSIIGPNALGVDTKVVCKLVEKIPADLTGLPAQSASIRQQLKSEREQARASLFEEGVKDQLIKEGKIKIHQDVIDRMIASYHS